MSAFPHRFRFPLVWTACRCALLWILAAAAGMAQAQESASTGDSWKACSSETDGTARLACFDRWAAAQAPATAATSANALDSALADSSYTQKDDDRPCSDPRSSPLSRFWELEPASDCGTFGLRGYRPLR